MLQVLPVLPDPLVFQVPPDQADLPDPVVLPDRLDPPVAQVTPDKRALLVPQDQLDQLEILAGKAPQDIQVNS